MAPSASYPRLLGLLFLAGSLTLPAVAQDTEADTDTLRLKRGPFTLRVEDGKVYLNGAEVDEGTTIIVMEDDGARRIVRLRGSGDLPDLVEVWRRSAPEVDVEVLRDRIERRTPEERAFFFHRDEGRPMRWFDGPGEYEYRFFYGVPDEDDFDAVLEAPGRIRDEEVMRLEREARQLARELRRAEGAERKRREDELRKKLEAIFERKMQLSQERLDALQEELEEARERLEARRRARSEIIERRLKELLGERDLYAW
ncbi:MAG: hypothetical protein KatS3mg043_0584 [Rhodothermaceae bacterium]|nr:MAG: hypothetical protein KatS3mg043_0584 [Rhodothermaceae bacterium]